MIFVATMLAFNSGVKRADITGDAQTSRETTVCQLEQRLNSEKELRISPLPWATSSSSAIDACKCYCGGQSWSPGSTACMGGFKQRCVDRNSDGTNCGWDTVKQGPEPVRCDGGENCNPNPQSKSQKSKSQKSRRYLRKGNL
jgi:hypothetical protein